MSQNFAAFKSAVAAGIWPNGTPENLVGQVGQFVVDGLVYLQRYVDCLQVNHTDTIPQCAMYWRCWSSVTDAPRGRIRKVTVIEDGDHCRPVTYRQVEHSELECFSRRFHELVDTPVNTGLGALPNGFKFPEASTDSEAGRSKVGVWAMDRGRLWISPWLQSNESVIVEWDGLKRDWAAGDAASDDPEVVKAIRLYVQREFARDFERDAAGQKVFDMDFKTALAELIYECRQERMVRQTPECVEEAEDLAVNG